MRYYFDNQAHSMVNRVLDVLARSSVTAERYEIKSVADEKKFNSSMGSFNESPYGFQNSPLLAAMWYEAEINTDWQAEADGLDEQYPRIMEAYAQTTTFDLHQTPKQMDLETLYYDAEAIAVAFENRLFLAVNVANALRALEGDNRNAWDALPAINEEFVKDRNETREKIAKVLDSDPFFAQHSQGV